MTWIVLKDLENRAKSFNLPHEVFCDEVGKCGCSKMPFTSLTKNRKTGKRTALKTYQKRICNSFTIPPAGESGPIDPAVLLCPEVAAQIASGKIVQRKWVEPVQAIPEPAEVPSSDEGNQDPGESGNDADGSEDVGPGGEDADETEDAPETADEPPVPLDALTIPQLQGMARHLGIEQPGRRKAKLIKKIEAKRAELADRASDTD